MTDEQEQELLKLRAVIVQLEHENKSLKRQVAWWESHSVKELEAENAILRKLIKRGE
jgi:hypothetical protein